MAQTVIGIVIVIVMQVVVIMLLLVIVMALGDGDVIIIGDDANCCSIDSCVVIVLVLKGGKFINTCLAGVGCAMPPTVFGCFVRKNAITKTPIVSPIRAKGWGLRVRECRVGEVNAWTLKAEGLVVKLKRLNIDNIRGYL